MVHASLPAAASLALLSFLGSASLFAGGGAQGCAAQGCAAQGSAAQGSAAQERDAPAADAAAPDAERDAALRQEALAMLDDFHGAAAVADLERYLGHLTPDALFVGTDATERWTTAEFREFTRPHFEAGRGWNYVPSARQVDLLAEGRAAAVFEHLTNATYGELRGSGTLVRQDGRWRIQHYVMSFPVPNELAPDLVERTRELLTPR
jgi:ketosteroid isomerase-like protein